MLIRALVQDWNSKGIHIFIWPVNTSVEKLYCNDVLHTGYLTDTIATDPVINPGMEEIRHENRRSPSAGPIRKQSPAANSSDEMQSIPPSPTASEFIANAYNTLAAVAGKLKQGTSQNSRRKENDDMPIGFSGRNRNNRKGDK